VDSGGGRGSLIVGFGVFYNREGREGEVGRKGGFTGIFSVSFPVVF
jgi:hypothetical protein